MSLKRMLFAASQVGVAAIALAAWLWAGATTPADQLAPAVVALGWGTVLGLVLTLGVPFTMPNLFRGLSTIDRHRSGPWSKPMLTVVGTTSGAALIGMTTLYYSADIGLSLVYAGSIAASTLTAQVARILDRLGLMAIALSPQVALPATFAAMTPAGVPEAAQVWVAASIFVALSGTMIYSMREMLRTSGTTLPARSVLVSAAPMVPHLVLFGALIQGPRLAASLVDSPSLLLQVHTTMLVINAATTLAGAANSVLSVDIQTRTTTQLLSNWNQCVRAFALLSLALTAVLTVGPWVVSAFVGDHMVASTSQLMLISSIGGCLSGYYAASALILRSGAPWRLPIVSGTATTIFAIAVIALPSSLIFVSYVAAMATLLVAGFLCYGYTQELSRQRASLILAAILPSALLAIPNALILFWT